MDGGGMMEEEGDESWLGRHHVDKRMRRVRRQLRAASRSADGGSDASIQARRWGQGAARWGEARNSLAQDVSPLHAPKSVEPGGPHRRRRFPQRCDKHCTTPTDAAR